ncbi:MAG TPA: elongation factor P [Dehalococcoidia bacterium]|nr:elongation factor P [Dehalococcoidia bacterium]
MISTSDMKRGATIELDGRVYQVMEFAHIKMGRGSAQMRMKLRDVRKGDIIERTFQAGEKWPRVRVERVPMQFSYAEDNIMHFMNTETYDQVPLTLDQVGDARYYLPENGTCDVLFLGDEPIGIELPASVVLKITECEPGVKGDTATGATKPAKMETGLVVNVPLFVNEGDRIKVNTATGEYQERA